MLINRSYKKDNLKELQDLVALIEEEYNREFGQPSSSRQTPSVTVSATSSVSTPVSVNASTTGKPREESICYECGQKGHFGRDHQPDGSIRRTPYSASGSRPRPRIAATTSASAPAPATAAPSSSDDALKSMAKSMETLAANMAALSTRVQEIEQARSKEDF